MRPWDFSEFESDTATVYARTVTTDALMGEQSTTAVRTTVGSSGVLSGSLQALGGNRPDVHGRAGERVDFVYFPAPSTAGFDTLRPSDLVVVGTQSYAVVHAEHETGATHDSVSPVIYLKRIR